MKIVNAEEFNELIKSGTTLVDFFAEWCGPCKMLGPVLEELDNEYPDINFVKVNVDDNMELAEQFGIMSIPNVHIFRMAQMLPICRVSRMLHLLRHSLTELNNSLAVY